MDNVPDSCKDTDTQDGLAGSATPADLHIQSRNRHFSGPPIQNRWWVGGDPYATAFFNALSATFPLAETFFISTVKQFREGPPEKLQREIRAFIQQEMVHSREHLIFNRHLEEFDYDLTLLDQSVKKVLGRIKAMEPIHQLAGTVCMEHLTAVIAAEIIANPKHFANADEDQKNLWLWHASEEIEHKGVTYDAWLHATRDWSRWKRWKMKSLFMARISIGFTKNRSKGVLELLRQDGISGPRAWFGLIRYALFSPAPFRRTLKPWFQFFLPGFHPWNIDDRHLIQLAESEYEAAILDQSEEEPTVAELADRLKKINLPKVA